MAFSWKTVRGAEMSLIEHVKLERYRSRAM